jgi:hypothetical protein
MFMADVAFTLAKSFDKSVHENATGTIEMKGVTRCKLTIISESGICKEFLGQIWSYAASL